MSRRTFEEEYISLPSEVNKQVGGTHYEDMNIQPWEYFVANAPKEEIVGACKQNILKYMRVKDDRITDLEKLIWYAKEWLAIERNTL